ncbi:RNA polymerase sigma factor [Pedobacter africanus]|uniref:RNA polymerase sigma-70 factor, ECF subfamily n=1 Tax=Pedobacter africanus TaxID=151894 RepID=A0A1W2CV76_9SPHI|nr:sigma-70 family RNA polymerase sigma factor [Pedobacter africanus]SMC88866.1 RNA polymerase sigma-70 factor, ECF subfamily [Pedobacter africanus]
MPIKPLQSEQELLAKVAKGDEYAFGLLYNQYNKKVFGFALQLLNSEILAEEVMQVTMLKLWQMEEGLNAIQNLDAYLRVTSRNISYNMLRRLKLEQNASEALGREWLEEHNETEEQIILKDTKKILEEAIEALPPQQKLVYQLCHQQGMKYEEAAKQLNLSPLSVQTYMKLALRFLRAYISKRTDVAALLIIFKLF